MKLIIHNTGFDADGIAPGEKRVVEAEEAHRLAEKWSGMMKILPYEEEVARPAAPAPAVTPAKAKPAKEKVAAKKPTKKGK